jgi:hypothetical protein
MYVSAEPTGIVDAAGPHGHQHTEKSFLPNIFDCVRVNPSRAQGDSQALTEVGNKMGFGGSIARTETAEIFFIKRVEVHWRSFQPVYFSRLSEAPEAKAAFVFSATPLPRL